MQKPSGQELFVLAPPTHNLSRAILADSSTTIFFHAFGNYGKETALETEALPRYITGR